MPAKSHPVIIAATLVLLTALSACSKNEVGDVSLGMFTTKDIKIESFRDPVVTGVTCHISHVKADLDFADPSDMGISCRQTGEISAEMIAAIGGGKGGQTIFSQSKSILCKSLKIRRIYDAENQTLLYLSYSTKEIKGSHKHSLTSVPLWGTQAWRAPPTGVDPR